MSVGMGREFTYLSSHATNRYFIPNWGKILKIHALKDGATRFAQSPLKKEQETLRIG